MLSFRLRDLIQTVRACKTAAEERAVVQKQSARVREELSKGSNRGTCMLRLMYISMLGYATEYSHMEVVKLLAEADFASKRVGYLALCVLMDEKQEVLTLAENHIKRDLVQGPGSNPFIQGIALDAIANIAGEDMARDLMNDVYSLITSTNTHVRKKAALAAQRCVRKAPDLIEVFLEDERATNFLSERNNGVLVCNLALLIECLSHEYGASYIPKFAALIPAAVKQLNGLVMSAYTNEHEVNGVSNPFLQVKLLHFLRVVGRGSEDAAESMNNVLAQAATNTPGDRNVGCAVLYECVRTILAIQCDDSLRVLAYNILARFMDRDNNCRFVALSMFLEVVRVDPEVAQRHRATVIDCLKDVDVSIRRRALQLTVSLVDESNVRLMASDLLAYLGVCSEELQAETTEHLCRVIETQSPSDEWRLEMSIRLLRTVQAHVTEAFAEHFIVAVTRATPELQERSTMALWEEFRTVGPEVTSHGQREGLLIASAWLCGEFSELLVQGGTAPDTVVACVGALSTESPSMLVRQYALEAVAKVAAKHPGARTIANSLFETAAASMDCELQQRGSEFLVLFATFPDDTLLSLFAAGGAFEATEEQLVIPATPATPAEAASKQFETAPTQQQKKPAGGGLDDLFQDLPKAPSAKGVSPTAPSTGAAAVEDVFAGLGGGSSSAPPVTGAARAKPSGGGDLDSIFGGGPAQPAAAPAARPAPQPTRPVYQSRVHDDGQIAIDVEAIGQGAKGSSSSVDVVYHIRNQSSQPVTGVHLLVAVPRSCSLELTPPSADSIEANGGVVDHPMTVRNNAGQAVPKLTMKVELHCKVGSAQKSLDFQFSKDLPLPVR